MGHPKKRTCNDNEERRHPKKLDVGNGGWEKPHPLHKTQRMGHPKKRTCKDNEERRHPRSSPFAQNAKDGAPEKATNNGNEEERASILTFHF
ncbi:MAG: hypothetical protein WBD87_11305 [Candidatus Acidiferrales bacterium]